MHITPFILWLCSCGLFIIAATLFPRYRLFLLSICAAHIPVFILGIKYIRMQFFGRLFCKPSVKKDTIALTFDDGPDQALTPDILGILKKHSIRATFFVVGYRAEKHPEIVRRCFDEGHTVACHDLTHSMTSNFRTTGPLVSDISKAVTIVKHILGKKPLLYRPPVGLMNPHTLNALKKLGMQCVGWSKSVKDAGNRRLNRVKHIHTLAQPDEVILLHDILPKPEFKDEILNKIEKLCMRIKERNLKAVGVDEMFGIKAYE
jgi:peptidoglycan/xylan/chitin deacetylase (PgdA/CDA1 family)